MSNCCEHMWTQHVMSFDMTLIHMQYTHEGQYVWLVRKEPFSPSCVICMYCITIYNWYSVWRSAKVHVRWWCYHMKKSIGYCTYRQSWCDECWVIILCSNIFVFLYIYSNKPFSSTVHSSFLNGETNPKLFESNHSRDDTGRCPHVKAELLACLSPSLPPSSFLHLPPTGNLIVQNPLLNEFTIWGELHHALHPNRQAPRKHSQKKTINNSSQIRKKIYIYFVFSGLP